MNIWRLAASAWANNIQKAKERKHEQIFNLIDVCLSKNYMYISTNTTYYFTLAYFYGL